MNTIVCPNCKEEIKITEAITHKMKEEILAKNNAQHKEELEKQKQEAEEKASLKIKSELEKVRLQAEKEFVSKNKAAQLALLESQKQQKILEDKLLTAEKEQKLKEEKIRQEATKEADEKSRLDRLMYEKKMADMQKSLEEAQRKGKQGSQQLQGEVMELDIEDKLKSLFPYDEFKPVAKGKEGADLIQYVKNKYGKTGSIILWEFKRTKNWDKKWLTKLREDARNANANESVIVSEALPENLKVYEKIDGVWVTDIKYALYLAKILREMGLRIAIAKSAVQHTDENLKKLHEYVLSEKFRHKIDRHREQTEMSIKLLEKKKKDDEKYYRDQKLVLDRLADNTPQIYFDLQEILPALPSISSIEPDLVIEAESSSETT